MNNKVIIDSSVLVGLLNQFDLHAQRAVDLFNAIKATSVMPAYLDCVVIESISVISRRLREKKRSQHLNQFFANLPAYIPPDEIVWVLPQLRSMYDEVLELMEQTNGELNFHDALIALICKQENIKYIASFDTDFDQIPWLTRWSTPADLAP